MMRTTSQILFSCITAFLVAAASASAQTQTPLTALRVESKPAAAEIYINQQGPFNAPYVTEELQPGTHLITVRAKGFHTHRQTITLVAGEKMPLSIDLQPVTGLVLIHTDPEDVEVKVNSLNKGSTPLLLTDLPVGPHTLHLSKPGYIERTIELTITGRAPKHITETLMPSSATLTVHSSPPGAKITLNGTSHGTTPATIDKVPAGTATLELQIDGHKTFSETLTLAAGQTAEINAELDAIPAAMKVVSIPPGARIYVNNQFHGESPVTLKNLAPGEYRIRGELAGYEPTARTIQLANAANTTEELRMESNSGQLVVVTQPAGVKVYIDGVEKGTTIFKPDETDKVSTPLTIDLVPVGEREVKLVAEKYHPVTLNVTINKNETTVLQPTELIRQFIPDLEVRTRDEVYTGVYLGTLANGDVGLEVRPGIIRRIPGKDIIRQRPIQAPTLPQ